MSANDFLKAKAEKRKLSMVTCYDYTFARLLAQTPVDGLLVGDSANMVMHGHPSTISANIELMKLHTEAVVRGAPDKFVVTDLPFLSYRKGIAAALDAAQVLMAAGAHALKLEGIDGHEDVIERMVGSGIPVMGHLGLLPQSLHAFGGYKVQGRGEAAASKILRQARALEAAGAFSIVLECIPAGLAGEVTAAVGIPTIGIGAGSCCDGQILVLQDLLGLNVDFQPKFARAFYAGARCVTEAISRYDAAVKTGSFPSREESYD
jgi:3-methyl-2-oxobutanoate hydroxymethyltransferase